MNAVDDTTNKGTLTEEAIQRLTADIVEGVLAPERKLLMADLKKQYGMGASPLREGLARLSSLGFVVFDSRRGFRVAPVSKADLQDITQVRQLIEVQALHRAFALGGEEWEVGVIAAYARLERAVARCKAGADCADLELVHKQFHTALIAGCHSQRLLDLQSVFYDQASRYRQVMMKQTSSLDDFLATHKQLLDAVIGCQTEAASSMISEHMEITLHKVYPEDSPQASKAKAARQPAAKAKSSKAAPAKAGGKTSAAKRKT